MKRQCARILLAALTVWGVIALAQPASAQLPPVVPESAPPDKALQQQVEALKKQLETQQQQIDQFMKLMKDQNSVSTQAPAEGDKGLPDGGSGKDAIDKAVQKAMADQSAKAKSDDAAKAAAGKNQWYSVGSDVKMTAKWFDGLYLQTANKDFYTHIGGWIQYDNVWWNQNSAIKAPVGAIPAGKSQPAAGGVGSLTDGDYWRRLRFQFEGGFWDVLEYNLVFAGENIQFDTIGMDEFWVGATKLPLIGNIRAGHVKIAQGLEGDAYSSSKAMTFFERAPYSDAFNQNFGTGLWLFNSFLDDRLFYGANLYRQDSTFASGENFGDGEYACAGRIAGLPWYSADGRCLVHLAASYAWRKAQTGFDAAGNPTEVQTVRLRARPELRDSNPAGAITDATSTNVLGGNKARLVDTGALVAHSSSVVGLEFLSILGPLSLQAEYEWCTVNDVTAPVKGNFTFSGGYVQLSYFLTGENRSYDKKLGRLDSYYLGRKGPYTPFWLVRGADGKLDAGWGAWELAGRYTYLNLNDGAVNGGKNDGWAAGVNWYLTSNLKVQFDYFWENRYSVPTGVIPGSVTGFGTRLQLVF